MDLELAGKAAIVTGGSRGIGKAIARALAQEGVDVAIAARSREPLEAAAAELATETGRRVVPIVADTGRTSAVEALVASAAGELGGLDILVNNAARPGGGSPTPGIESVTDENFAEEMNTKVLGYLRCARAVAPPPQGARLGPNHQRQWAGRTPVGHRYREHAQRRRCGADEEPRG